MVNLSKDGLGKDATTITRDANIVLTTSNLASHLHYSFKANLAAISTTSSSSSTMSTSCGGNSIGVACLLNSPSSNGQNKT